MNVKKGLVFTVIVSLIVLSAANLKFNDLAAQNNNTSTGDLSIEESDLLERLKTSDNTLDDQIDTAEDAAQWLRTEWLDNKFSRSGEIRLGQDGISGIGGFFVELYQATGNSNYRTWAIDIADFLISQHALLGYPDGKWPNKIAVSGVSNYSSYEQGAAGIGSFFINLYNITLNNTHRLEASQIHDYLDSIDVSTVSGLAWEEQESLSYTDGLGLVSFNNIFNGTETGGTQLSNLNSHDGSTYQIDADANFVSDVTYSLNLTQLIPFEDLPFIDDYISQMTVKISVVSNAALTSGDVFIRNTDNQSWVQMNGASISTTEQEFTKVINSDISNWTGVGLIRVNVNTTAVGAHRISIDALNYTMNYNNGFNSSSFSTGAAGIGNFYLDMLENDIGNATLTTKAQGAGNFIIEQAIIHGDVASWYEKGSYFTTISQGAAGIGKYLLRLAKTTAVATYRDFARRAGEWLISNNGTYAGLIIQNVSLLWTENNETITDTNTIIPGMDYCAGIGQFLLELGQDLGGVNRYIRNASYAANWLMNTQYMVDEEQQFDYDVYCKWQYSNNDEYGYEKGTAGALEFIDNMFSELGYTNYSNILSRGMEWVINTINITTDKWKGNDNSTYSIGEGLAGVGLGLLRINLKKAYITADVAPTQLEFNVLPRVEFSIGAYGSNINKNNTYISYAYGTKYLAEDWTIKHLNYSSGDNYFFDFPYIQYNNTWHYAIIVVDNNNTVSFDNNGFEYQLNIVDTVAPITRLVPQWTTGIGAGDSGILEVRVKKNDTNGAPFDHCRVQIPLESRDFNIEDNDANWEWDSVYGEYVFEVQVTVSADKAYGTIITVQVDTVDFAGNTEVDIEIFQVADNFVPTLTEPPQTPSTRWVPQFIEVEVEAKVTDIGAGLDDHTGVFVKYTTDDGASWQTAFLSKSGSKWVGKIPGQFLLAKVYYVYGAKDKSGNEVYWDIFHSESGRTFSSPDEIASTNGLEAMYSYSITINWTMLLVVVGVIALIVVSGYLIYSKRGGYLERMRRKSKATATGLAIKEKITDFYYKLYDKMNKIGERMSKGMSGGGGKIQLWFSDHFGGKPKTFFTKVGRFLWAIPKGIFNGIANLFKGLGRAITNSKAWQIIFFMGLGFTMLITTVLQFLMAAGYPLRAVFFANMGFIMLISGIVTFLLRFIYKLSYK